MVRSSVAPKIECVCYSRKLIHPCEGLDTSETLRSMDLDPQTDCREAATPSSPQFFPSLPISTWLLMLSVAHDASNHLPSSKTRRCNPREAELRPGTLSAAYDREYKLSMARNAEFQSYGGDRSQRWRTCGKSSSIVLLPS